MVRLKRAIATMDKFIPNPKLKLREQLREVTRLQALFIANGADVLALDQGFHFIPQETALAGDGRSGNPILFELFGGGTQCGRRHAESSP